MSTHRYVVVARKSAGQVEFDEHAERCAVRYRSETREVEGHRAGEALWEVMRAGGLSPHDVNGFTVYEGDEDGVQIASLHPILRGAHAVWLVLYRANKEGSCFGQLGTRQRVVDALGATFEKLRAEIKKPFKG